jgi:threonine dehydrogenase-like Zn-dependent dehydrogenase
MNVAIVGCGVRGSIVAAILAGAGIEELSLIDGLDVKDEDLRFSALLFTPDLRKSKAEALAPKLGLINPDVRAETFPAFLEEDNAEAMLTGVDCVVDCADWLQVGAIAEVCTELGIPLISPPKDFKPRTTSDSSLAHAIGALQAQLVLAFRRGESNPRGKTVWRVDLSSVDLGPTGDPVV